MQMLRMARPRRQKFFPKRVVEVFASLNFHAEDDASLIAAAPDMLER
jgi:hypothetical protein